MKYLGHTTVFVGLIFSLYAEAATVCLNTNESCKLYSTKALQEKINIMPEHEAQSYLLNFFGLKPDPHHDTVIVFENNEETLIALQKIQEDKRQVELYKLRVKILAQLENQMPLDTTQIKFTKEEEGLWSKILYDGLGMPRNYDVGLGSLTYKDTDYQIKAAFRVPREDNAASRAQEADFLERLRPELFLNFSF